MRGLSRTQIRTLFDVGTVVGLTDGQLLERFATRRDEGGELAFAALVERHGPMVLHTCRGILRDDHEALDACQATFLVLARRGGTLWVRDSLGPWLHRVACRAAGRARSQQVRRRRIETRAAATAATRPSWGDHANEAHDRKELVAVIHDEVNRLPERYRSPIVLCDLEGRTCEEAARHLGCPVGTIGTRLARGRQRLRDRLQRRGLAPNASLIAVALGWPDRPVGTPLPAELVGTLSRAAVHFVSVRMVIQGGSASLALGVLRSMTMTHWLKVALLLVTSVSATGVVTLAFTGKDATSTEPLGEDPPRAQAAVRAGDAATTDIKPGRLVVKVSERGTLEPAQSEDVISAVEGSTSIVSLVPEGTRVKKGDLIVELDSTALQDQLAQQTMATSGTETVFQNARATQEVAELALQEYQNGRFPQEVQVARGAIELARSAMAWTEERVQRLRNYRQQVKALLVDKEASKTAADLLAALEIEDRLGDAQQSLARERITLETAQAKLEVLEKFTGVTTIKRLQVELQKARSDESGKRIAWEREQSKETKLKQQLASCRIVAPADGTVVYAKDRRAVRGGVPPLIGKGSRIRDRQKLMSVINLNGPFRINTKVHESLVDQLGTGLPATIQIDAFPSRSFTGKVESVAPLPDPSSIFGSDIKFYTAHVSIENKLTDLRPGMTAAVEIQVADLKDVLTVPVQALVRYDELDHVAVKGADDSVAWREVVLGRSNGQFVEVKEGLKPGETVITEPGPLLSETQKRKVSESASRPSRSLRNRARAMSVSPALRGKLQALAPEELARINQVSPDERAAILKKAGLTDEEIRLLEERRGNPAKP